MFQQDRILNFKILLWSQKYNWLFLGIYRGDIEKKHKQLIS